MGNKLSMIFNSDNLSNLNTNQTNNNSQNNLAQSNKKEEKSIPYSYVPDSSEDEEDNTPNNNNNSKGKLKCIRVIKGHYKWCNCLVILKSKNLCSCSGDKSINIYSNDNNFNVILTLSSCHEDFILYMMEIYDSILASSSSDGTVKFWKIFLNSNIPSENSYYLIQTIVAHESDAWKILFIQENNNLISCSSDSLIKIWDINLIQKNKNMKNNSNDLNDDEKDIIEYKLSKILNKHKFWVSSIIQVKNDEKGINYLVSGSGDTTIKFFDINKDYLFIHSINKMICCQQGSLVNYDNKRFLIGGGKGIFFFVINFINFQIEAKIYGGNEEVCTILVLQRNKYIHDGGFLIGGKECSFHYISEYFYNYKKIKENAHEKYIYCLIQLGENLIASSSYDNAIKIWKYDENTFK